MGAVDGKELRGSIASSTGDKRGESVVKVVSHKTKLGSIIGFYNATKESEKPVVKSGSESGKIHCKLSFDALHSSQSLLEIIEVKKYLFSPNQRKLADLVDIHTNLPCKEKRQSIDKGHGLI